MPTYTNIEAFLKQFVQDILLEKYNKATFPKALEEQEWLRLIADMSSAAADGDSPSPRNTVLNGQQVVALWSIGILPVQPEDEPVTYGDLSARLAERLELIKFARENIKDFTAVRH